MRECMHRAVEKLPGFGAGRGEGLSRRRPEVNGPLRRPKQPLCGPPMRRSGREGSPSLHGPGNAGRDSPVGSTTDALTEIWKLTGVGLPDSVRNQFGEDMAKKFP